MDAETYRATEGRVTEASIREAMEAFLGKVRQIPPKYSALFVDGKRAYDLARKERDFELPSREIEIFSFGLKSFSFPIAAFEAEVSAGTYVRSIARDLGADLGAWGVITELRRTRVGRFRVEDAFAHPKEADRSGAVGTRDMLPHVAAFDVSDAEASRLLDGLEIRLRNPLPEGENAIAFHNGEPISLCKSHA